MKNIYVILKGGLGNQFFQISKGIEEVSGNLDHLFIVDTSYIFDSKRTPAYELFFSNLNKSSILNRLLMLPLSLAILSRNVIFKRWVGTDESSADSNYILSGYFQNYLGTARFSELLKKSVLDRCRVSNSYPTLHVRRTDFFKHEVLVEEYTKVMLPYYKRVIKQYFKEHKHEERKVYIVSDDLDGAIIDLLALDLNVELIPAPTHSMYEDFVFLSQAETLICSNSTFCWWAARINDGLRYMPAGWLEREYKMNSRDLHIPGTILI